MLLIQNPGILYRLFLFVTFNTLVIGLSTAQTVINPITDSVWVNKTKAPFRLDATNTLIFRSGFQEYDNRLWKYGLHFNNHRKNVITANVMCGDEEDKPDWNKTWFYSPAIGVHGAGTKVIFRGQVFKGDNTATKTSIMLSEGGRFIFGKESNVDLVFPRYGNYTRQIWAMGDGTGVLEFENGFISDRSEHGNAPNACGSIRLNNITLLTHGSESLPYYWRPDPKSADKQPKINSHLVIDGGKKNKWIIASNNQLFVGGIWLKNGDIEIYTSKELEISGRITDFADYRNYGGVHFIRPYNRLIKTGKARLIISGDQLYSKGSTIDIREGIVRFASVTFSGDTTTHNLEGRFKVGQFLNLNIAQSAKAESINQKLILDTLTMSAKSEIKIPLESILKANVLHANGVLSLYSENIKPGRYRIIETQQWKSDFRKIKINSRKYVIKTNEMKTTGIIEICSK